MLHILPCWLHTLLEGVKLASSLGLTSLAFELDSQPLITMLQHPGNFPLWKIKLKVASILHFSYWLQLFSFWHISRNLNLLASTVAKLCFQNLLPQC